MSAVWIVLAALAGVAIGIVALIVWINFNWESR